LWITLKLLPICGTTSTNDRTLTNRMSGSHGLFLQGMEVSAREHFDEVNHPECDMFQMHSEMLQGKLPPISEDEEGTFGGPESSVTPEETQNELGDTSNSNKTVSDALNNESRNGTDRNKEAESNTNITASGADSNGNNGSESNTNTSTNGTDNSNGNNEPESNTNIPSDEDDNLPQDPTFNEEEIYTDENI
jgi:hypothetical protein